MENKNTQSQSLSTASSLPPLTTTTPSVNPPVTNGGEWPVKKSSNKWKTIVGGVLAILLVVGAAGGAFYFTRNLNQASVPTAPESEPLAANPTRVPANDNCKQGCSPGEVCRSDGRCVKAGGKLDNVSVPTTAPYQCNSSNCPGPRWYCSSSTNCVDRGPGVTGTPAPEGSLTKDSYYKTCYYTTSTGTCYDDGALNGDGSCDAGYYACNIDGGTKKTCCNVAKTEPTEKVGGSTEKTTAPTAPVCEAKAPIQGTRGAAARTATNSADLSWVNETTAGTLKLWVSRSADPKNCTPNGVVPDCVVNGIGLRLPLSSYQVTGLQPNTKYYWTIMSYVSDTCQATSSIANFTTGALACVNSTWTPNANTVCTGNTFIQTSNCDATRSATGTKTDGACATCTDTTWTPNQNTVCVGDDLVQTSNCGTTRTVDGTKTDGVCEEEEEDGEPELTIEKRAFEDEEDNKAGEYNLDDEIDTVSKEQVFVYAFDIYNAGDGKAENIEVTDTLKGNNQELLTYVDGDSRCTYTSSTRKVVCSGMNLESEEDDVYAFRVKVSSSATNGETIRNVGVLTYDDMPTDGEDEASLELDISTVVSCNHNCTSDSECSSGLTCDPEINKCRKSACLESSNCVCPLPPREPTEAPTKKATATQKAQPTSLPEAGILDLPGVAAFGGGLLLAIIGILLAL